MLVNAKQNHGDVAKLRPCRIQATPDSNPNCHSVSCGQRLMLLSSWFVCVLFFLCRVGTVISIGEKNFLRLTRDNSYNKFKISTGPETDHYSIQANS